VEQEIYGELIGNNAWKCDLRNSSWSLEHIKEELAFLVAGDPGGVVLWFRQKSRFRLRKQWTRVAIRSGQERVSTISVPDGPMAIGE